MYNVAQIFHGYNSEEAGSFCAFDTVSNAGLTFPPWAPRTAKQKSVEGVALPGMENSANAAA